MMEPNMKLRDAKHAPALHRKDEGKNEAGFTLLETTIAMIVMLVVGLSTASLFFLSVTNNTGARERAMATAIAQRRIEWLRALPFDDPDSTNDLVALPADSSEQMVLADRNFTVRTRIFGAGTSMRTIKVEVSTNGRGPAWAREPAVLTTQRAALVQ